MRLSALTVLLFTAVGARAGPSPSTYDIRVDHMPVSASGAPLVTIQSAAPTLSFALRHPRRGALMAAYRVTVNRTLPGAAAGPGPLLWDSGVVASNRSVGIPYGGAPLPSDSDFCLRVSWRDDAGVWSAAPPGRATPCQARFSTGLLAADNADWNGTAWMGGLAADDERNQFRRVFRLPAPPVSGSGSGSGSARARGAGAGAIVRARCYVAAPGYHRTYLNGVRLGGAEEVLGPATQFDRRVPYQAYDCVEALRGGVTGEADNVLATTLGRGWWALPDGNGQTDALGYHTIGARSVRVLITAQYAAGAQWRLSDESSDGPSSGPSSGLDSGWRHARGPVVADSLFLGTVVDGRRETPGWMDAGYDDASWDAVATAASASASASAQLPLTAATPPLVALTLPPIRRLSPRAPTSIVRTSPGVALLDFGVNQAGVCRIVVDDASAASPGDVMRLRRAEGVTAAGALDQTWLLKGAQENCSYTFRADGTREVYEDMFAFFGFRFLELSGWPGGALPPADAVTCWATHTDLERSSEINFVAPVPSPGSAHGVTNGTGAVAALLNDVQALIVRSALSNFPSHPTDCPTREKRGWTGDGGHAAETLLLNFGMGAPYAKWLDDIADAAANSNGVVPDMAPFLFGSRSAGNSDPAWGTGFADLLGWHHRYHGDTAVLRRHFAAAARYVDGYLGQYVSSDTGLLTTSYPGTRYGDWCAPSGDALTASGARHTSNVISGYFWIRQNEVLMAAARQLGNATAAAGYAATAARARASFGRLYFDAAKGAFRDPQWTAAQGPEVFQTEQALALTLALDLQHAYAAVSDAPAIVSSADAARAGAALAADVEARGAHHAVGMVGIKYVLPALAAVGRGDLALAALAAPDYPGFGYMVANGEGSLWERWEGGRNTISGSRNHIMLGSPGQWMFQALAGISVARGGVAWDRLNIAPLAAAAAPGSGLGGVDATVGTPRGPATVSWRALPPTRGLCGTAQEKDLVGEPLHLDCGADGGVIGEITFASYGTPAGSCADPSALAVDAGCHAPTSSSVVTAACVGKASCTLFANNTQFGGQDPCSGTLKRLVVAATCAGGCTAQFALNATVPGGSTATIVVPAPGLNATLAGAATLAEGGVPFFRNGSFVPGAVDGIVSARVGGDNAGFEVIAGGGRYAFTLARC